MPIMQGRTSVPANSVVDNLLAGLSHEFIGRPSVVEVAVVQIDGAAGDVFVDVSSGNDILAENMPLQLRATGINIREDIYLEDPAAAGERLKIRARNTNAAARVVNWLVRVTPVM